jgi:hypothetical protein
MTEHGKSRMAWRFSESVGDFAMLVHDAEDVVASSTIRDLAANNH